MNANEFNPNAASENNIATSAGVSSGNAPGTLNDQGDHSSEWASSTLEALAPDTPKDHSADEPTTDTQPPKFTMQGSYPCSNASVVTPVSVSQLVPGAFPQSTDRGPVPLPNEQQGKDITTTAPDRDVPYVKEGTTSALETVHDSASAESSRSRHIDASASSPRENSDLAAGIDTKERAASISAPQPSTHDASSTTINSSTKKNAQHAPSADEDRTETMREGLEGVKENPIPGKPKSPRKVTPDNDKSTFSATEASLDEYITPEQQSEEAGADTDASTRSLVGTQINQTLYTPGTSLFSGKVQDDAQSTVSSIPDETAQDERSASGERVPLSAYTSGAPGHDVPDSVASKVIGSLHASRENGGAADVKAPQARQEDTEAKSLSPSLAQPIHRHTPVTKGREHPLAPHEETLGTAPGAQVTAGVNPASPQRPCGGEPKPASGTSGWERGDSARATPGHGPPPVPRKEGAGTGAQGKPATGVGAVAGSAASGAGAAGDVGGMGAGNATPTPTTKPAHAHAHGARPNGDGGDSNGTEGKKPGFFEKLKKEVRALSGKHHREDSAGKNALKN